VPQPRISPGRRGINPYDSWKIRCNICIQIEFHLVSPLLVLHDGNHLPGVLFSNVLADEANGKRTNYLPLGLRPVSMTCSWSRCFASHRPRLSRWQRRKRLLRQTTGADFRLRCFSSANAQLGEQVRCGDCALSWPPRGERLRAPSWCLVEELLQAGILRAMCPQTSNSVPPGAVNLNTDP
jgi:hypothetical protein